MVVLVDENGILHRYILGGDVVYDMSEAQKVMERIAQAYRLQIPENELKGIQGALKLMLKKVDLSTIPDRTKNALFDILAPLGGRPEIS